VERTVRPRIDDVAREAGVSKTAVSFAFNSPERLAPETAERIRAVAEQLGYTPHPVARMLTQGATLTIGVLTPQPLSVVFDSYATGDHSQANISVVNQSAGDRDGLRVRVRVYDLQGRLRDDRTAGGIAVAANGGTKVMTLPREALNSRVFFVRCDLMDASGAVVADNVYWQSQQRDDVGNPRNDTAFSLKQVSWADMTPLNTMPRVPLDVTAHRTTDDGRPGVTVRLSNDTGRVAFFERAEVLSTHDGDEILPVEYSDNYVTVFPGESVELRATLPDSAADANWVRVQGYNTPTTVVPVGDASR